MVNEPGVRMEEQINSLFPDRETQVCRGWALKKGQILYIRCITSFLRGDIRDNVSRRGEIIRQREKGLQGYWQIFRGRTGTCKEMECV